MPLPIEDARELLAELNGRDLMRLVAEAESRRLLQEVGEGEANLPRYDEDIDERVTALAYAYLTAGCSLAEQGEREAGVPALERGAKLLRDAHWARVNSSRESNFNVLIAAMSAYAAGQYSWAFVMLHEIAHRTEVAKIIAAFLRRDRREVQSAIGRVLLADVAPENLRLAIEVGATRAVARAVAWALEFAYTGHRPHLEQVQLELTDATAIAENAEAPSWWWIARLLALMIKDLDDASPWTVLPPLIGDGEEVTSKLHDYVSLLAFDDKPVYELWRSQRAALPNALGPNAGAVVSLKTSGGKTRVAEIAMLQALASDPSAKVLFLAPFRSLAFEMEQTFARSFRPLGYAVSHLYGGSRASRSDEELAEEAHIIVATPEKARALFRAAPDLFASMKLIVIDEGHLIGGDVRDVRNEMYYEHLRVRAQATGARILLLSAALPNPEEIAKWIAGHEEFVGTSDWRPSAQRVGLLRWNESQVQLEWHGDVPSFNPHFVVPEPNGNRKNSKNFPSILNEAVAATAARLSANGRTTMIFVAQARSVQGMARNVLRAMELRKDPEKARAGDEVVLEHGWPEREWSIFQALCEEELPDDAIELRAARAGIICHSNTLPAQVRVALEHLMRAGNPRIVIATKTLAQGVNLGVSTVIIASTLITKGEWIKSRDFLNIAGRAGRAFVDVEGRLLYAIDETHDRDKQEERARKYLTRSRLTNVTSGVLLVVRVMANIAGGVGISFSRLLELALENNYEPLGARREEAENLCDLIDDALLSVNEDILVNGGGEEPAVWIERLFRHSLAALQAGPRFGAEGFKSDDVLNFLVARARAAVRRAPTSESRRAVVASSLPLRAALRVYGDLGTWTAWVDEYVAAASSREALATFVAHGEEWLGQHVPFLADEAIPEPAVRSSLRQGWLDGKPLKDLAKKHKKALSACRGFYGITLTWLLHAVSQELKAVGDEVRAEHVAEISLCVENGLPSAHACRIQLAGIRSRAAAAELARTGIDLGKDISLIRANLTSSVIVTQLKRLVSARTFQWLELTRHEMTPRPFTAPSSDEEYTLPGAPTDQVLMLRSLGDEVFLCTMDGRFAMPAPRFLFKGRRQAVNDPRYVFVFDDIWRNAWLFTDRSRSARP